jgi:hypothetical protein
MAVINVDVNQSVDSILRGLVFTTKVDLVVINKTGSPLLRVGAHNEQENWPLGDIQSNSAGQANLKVSPTGVFSFAVNYKTADDKYFQFGAGSPLIGRKKIELTALNQTGNGPARQTWDKMSNKDDKNVANAPYKATAQLRSIGGADVWVFAVESA